MTIRIRKADGSVIEVPTEAAVEILNGEKLALLVSRDMRGSVHLSYPGEPRFVSYCRTFSIRPATVHRHSAPDPAG